MKKFGPDFYSITDLLTDEELLIQQTANDFVKAEFMPLISEHYENGTFPMQLIPKLGELGFMGSSLPEESGGAGVSNVAYGLILHELERGDSGLRSFASVQGSLVMYPIHAYGSDDQKAKWLPGLGAGNLIGCFGLTEPNFGSNPGGMTTRCKRDGDNWIINGNKMWITNGSIDEDGTPADLVWLYAKTGEDSNGRPEISTFLIEKGMTGYSVGQKIYDKSGMRASNTAELVFENCIVPPSNLVGSVGGSTLHMMRNLEIERIALAAMSLGIARRSLVEMNRYASERHSFGKPIREYGQIQRHIAESYAEYKAMQSYVYNTARLINLESGGYRLDTDGVKLFSSTVAKNIADRAIQVMGGYGYVGEYVVERLWRDSKLLEIGGGTIEMHQKNMTRELYKNPDSILK